MSETSAATPTTEGAARSRAGTGRPPWALSGGAVLVAALFALPGGYVLWRALTGGALHLLTERRSLEPLWRTVQLAFLVSASAALLGTVLAWLTVRTDLPLRRFWRVVAPLPLVYPSFVGAAAFRSGLTPGGIVHDLAGHLGFDLQLRLHGLVGAWLVLTLFTYPYVYLPVAARLSALPSSLEENARLLGDRPLQVFRRVVVPQASSSIGAGSLLVFLYTVSDFGAVHLMRFETLTQTIYRTRLFDQGRSFALALLLDASRTDYPFRSFSSQPAVYQDLALVVNDDVPAGIVMATIRESAGELLTDISLFDIYRGEQLGEGKKSLAFQLTFCATDRSLEEKEINELREAMLGPLEEKLGAKIRA